MDTQMTDPRKIKSQGHVYVLNSPNSEFLKIGGTDFPPLKRINEINNTEPYKSHGPWGLVDFREVADWRKVESFIHYAIRSKQIKEIEGQKELFRISSYEASKILNEINPDEIIRKPKVDRLFQDEIFLEYIIELFKFTGLLNWLDIQGAWTLSLFPMTSGGRYFTLNIGPHEVSFSTLQRNGIQSTHMLLMDKLIFDFSEVKYWIKYHNGEIQEDSYKYALPRSASLIFGGTFEDAKQLMKLDGVRRALIAYWTEALIGLKERNTLSTYSKYHNWNAVAKISAYIRNGNN